MIEIFTKTPSFFSFQFWMKNIVIWRLFDDQMIQDLKTKLKAILENSIISSAKRIGRPIFVNLPTYYVRFSSDHAQPTYLPKIGRH